MIHQYKNNGYAIVLDVNSGSVHVVDEIVYDVIALLDQGAEEAEVLEKLRESYPEEELKTALDEIHTLTSRECCSQKISMKMRSNISKSVQQW